MSNDNITVPQILKKCKEHKGYNIRFALRLWEPFPDNQLSARIYSCGSDISTQGEKIVAGNLCRERWCPFCQWRKSILLGVQNAKVFKYLTEKYGYRYVFLTLTVPNVKLENLRSKFQEMQKSWARFTHTQWFKQLGVAGLVRTVELTYNPSVDTWHPHYHVVLCVPQGVWLPAHEDWLQHWRFATRDETIKFVNIKSVSNDGFVKEISKYIVKSKDILQKFDFRNFWDLAASIKGLRFYSCSGCWKQARKDLCLQDPEEVQLTEVKTSDEKIIDWSFNYGIHEYQQR